MMKLRLKEQVTLEDGLKVMVSRRIKMDDFGVRGKETIADTHQLSQNGRFICTGEPGTGFFERESESDSYKKFVTSYAKKMESSLMAFIKDENFTYEKEIDAVDKALPQVKGAELKILESYAKCLHIAKEVNYLHRIVDGVREKMGSRPTRQYTSAISDLKSSIHSKYHELSKCRLRVEHEVSEELMACYREFRKVFVMTENSHRIWSSCGEKGKEVRNRVFWDEGVFDYIKSPCDIPLMRDAQGVWYYIYPTYIVRAESAIQFKVLPLDKLKVEYRETSGDVLAASNTSVNYMSGRPIGEVYFADLNLSFYFKHRSVAHRFVDALHTYQTQLSELKQ